MSSITRLPGFCQEVAKMVDLVHCARLCTTQSLCQSAQFCFLVSPIADIAFHIKADDIVRCMGHIERTRKHTLFVSMLPACSRRFASVFGDDAGTCSLMAMFFPAVQTGIISKLIHIFWNMSKKSIFGQLFCEVDSKAALDLLGHIRPAILSRFASGDKKSDGACISNGEVLAPMGVARRHSHTDGEGSKAASTTAGSHASHQRASTAAERATNTASDVCNSLPTSGSVDRVSCANHLLTRCAPTVPAPRRTSLGNSAGTATTATPTSPYGLGLQSNRSSSDELQPLFNWLNSPVDVPLPPLGQCSPSARTSPTSTVSTMADDFMMGSNFSLPGALLGGVPDTGGSVGMLLNTGGASQFSSAAPRKTRDTDNDVSVVHIEE